MRLLLDANLSYRIAALLRARGFDASHVRDHGLQHADDEAIFDFAAADGSVVVSEDTDFGEVLPRSPADPMFRPDGLVKQLADRSLSDLRHSSPHRASSLVAGNAWA